MIENPITDMLELQEAAKVNIHIPSAIVSLKSPKEVFKWRRKVFKRYKKTMNFKIFS